MSGNFNNYIQKYFYSITLDAQMLIIFKHSNMLHPLSANDAHISLEARTQSPAQS